MNTVRRMRIKNFAEVRTPNGDVIIIKFDNEVSKDDLNSLKDIKNIKDKYSDRLVTKKEYNTFLGKETTRTKTKKEIINNAAFVGSKNVEERDEYLEDFMSSESEIVNLNLDSVIGKKQVDGYYMPEETIAIARRVILNRPIWISGPSGCLTRNEKISIKVSEKIFNIIERNKQKE